MLSFLKSWVLATDGLRSWKSLVPQGGDSGLPIIDGSGTLAFGGSVIRATCSSRIICDAAALPFHGVDSMTLSFVAL